MEMTLRWYGSKFDTVTLEQIRQIPGVTGVITTLYDTAPGDVWSRERIQEMKAEVAAAGLHVAGIESVNVHDAIKTGSADRDKYIDNYIETLENLGKEDIHLVCYNFMPVFDWTRTELARKRPDGSTVLAYTQEAVDAINPEDMFASISGDMNGTVMPGWEPERMAKIKDLFAMYKDIDDEKLFENLKYFLERIMPVCDKYDINMAIHPDDPAWSVFGLPRIIINKKNILRMMEMVDNPHNGVTFCSGSYGTNLENDLPDMIRSLKGRLDNMTIGLCGDLKFGRTVHSLVNSLVRFNDNKFYFISPEELKVPDYLIEDTLIPNKSVYKEVRSLEDTLPELDVLYMTRVQRERFFNEDDYIRLKDTYILNKEKLQLAPADMPVLHPLPRVDEISTDVDTDKRAAYFEQVQNGKYIRMALIMSLLELTDPLTGKKVL